MSTTGTSSFAHQISSLFYLSTYWLFLLLNPHSSSLCSSDYEGNLVLGNDNCYGDYSRVSCRSTSCADISANVHASRQKKGFFKRVLGFLRKCFSFPTQQQFAYEMLPSEDYEGKNSSIFEESHLNNLSMHLDKRNSFISQKESTFKRTTNGIQIHEGIIPVEAQNLLLEVAKARNTIVRERIRIGLKIIWGFDDEGSTILNTLQWIKRNMREIDAVIPILFPTYNHEDLYYLLLLMNGILEEI